MAYSGLYRDGPVRPVLLRINDFVTSTSSALSTVNPDERFAALAR